MSTKINQIGTPTTAGVFRGVTRAGYFILHFLEMCLVMCLPGITVLSMLLRWSGEFVGYTDPETQLPEFSTLALALWTALLMIVWMRFRGHEWRPTLEMASTSMVALPLLFGAAWLGVIPKTELYSQECGLACVFMVVAMLFRLEHYTGHHASHSQHSAHTID